ncbi:MAG: NnrS family protein [Cardiobacteriaceae bacterium]|nr:NnrS family protein [Cardiobacteriaceae bacterium]
MRKRSLTPSELLRDFLAHPLRIFFLALPVAIIAAGLPWFLTGLGIQPPVTALPWHLYLYLDLAAAAAYGGFLLTALVSWTDYTRPLLRTSSFLFACWGIALLSAPWHAVSTAFLAAYWLGLLAFAVRLAFRDRRQDSLLYCLLWINALHLAYAMSADALYLRAMLHIHLIALMIVQFRVGMVIGNEALSDAMRDRDQHPRRYPLWLRQADETPRFIPNPIAKNLAALSLSILAAALCLSADHELHGWLALAAAGVLLANLQPWHHLLLLRRRYVRPFYAALLLPALGYLGYAASLLIPASPLAMSASLHLIAIGGYLLMILNIMHIAGLRHSGQTLRYTLASRLAFALIIAATLLRGVLSPWSASHWPSAYLSFTYTLPSLCAALAFILYALRFYGIFRDYPSTDGEE